jgi:hypothetical protein
MSAEPSTISSLVRASLAAEQIDLDAIRTLCASGLSDCLPEDRAASWLLLSRILPLSAHDFPSVFEYQLRSYTDFIDAFGVADYHAQVLVVSGEAVTSGVPQGKLMAFIHGDVARTQHHTALLPPSDPNPPESHILAPFTTHMRRMERILYIFANVNPAFSYLQGFHEIVCVIYYVFVNALSWLGGDMLQVEATAFFSFQQLMGSTRIQELFQTADNSSLIHHTLRVFMDLVAVHVPDAAAIIKAFDVHPLSFAFKWLNLLFAQDHRIPNLLLIWDALFAHFERLVEYAMYIGVAHVRMINHHLSAKNYFSTLDSLQSPAITDIPKLLGWAKKFFMADVKKHGKKKTKGFLAHFKGDVH